MCNMFVINVLNIRAGLLSGLEVWIAPTWIAYAGGLAPGKSGGLPLVRRQAVASLAA